jgi:hypothetical protein
MLRGNFDSRYLQVILKYELEGRADANANAGSDGITL